MPDMTWLEAIIQVLKDAQAPLTYGDIALRVSDSGYRKKIGATPAMTVASVLSTSIRSEGDDSPFVRYSRGLYGLKEWGRGAPVSEEVVDANDAAADSAQAGLINAYGMFWRRDQINWKMSSPRIWGKQQSGSQRVDFAPQSGVYILYDGARVIYVGKADDTPLGRRLRDHTLDRLSGRWDRFSWFGVRGVSEDGTLNPRPTSFPPESLISTLEALLIEGLEPPQNRRQGEGFGGLEFIQEPDPDLEAARMTQKIADLVARNR